MVNMLHFKLTSHFREPKNLHLYYSNWFHIYVFYTWTLQKNNINYVSTTINEHVNVYLYYSPVISRKSRIKLNTLTL